MNEVHFKGTLRSLHYLGNNKVMGLLEVSRTCSLHFFADTLCPGVIGGQVEIWGTLVSRIDDQNTHVECSSWTSS